MGQSCCAHQPEVKQNALKDKVVLYKPLLVILAISLFTSAALNLAGHDSYMDGVMGLFLIMIAMLKLMADQRLDAIIYATYDAPPAVIAPDVLTNPRPNDGYSRGDNRGLSPTLAWPAITVPMGFSPDGLPAGLEFLGKPWSEPKLLGFAYAYEQATKHRRPPTTTPALQSR